MAGKGRRFSEQGWNIPKQLITINGRTLVDISMQSIRTENCNLIFIVREEHVSNFHIDQILKKQFGPDTTVIPVKGDTEGAVCSCLYAKKYINNETSLSIYCLDVEFRPKFNPYKIDTDVDGLILTFRSNSPNYSYVQTDFKHKVTRTAEKLVISNEAATGLYYFKHGRDFVSYANMMLEDQEKQNNEYYICPLYNYLIKAGKNIITSEVDKMYVFGTPEELDFTKKVSYNKFGVGSIALCADHSGYELKEAVKKMVYEGNRFNVELNYNDFGTYINENCDQVDYTKLACKSIIDNECKFGFGFCRTGQAINITANKFPGIRAAVVFDEYTAEHAIRHNGANFLSFASKYVSKEKAFDIINKLLEVSFDGGRHQNRVMKYE